MNKSTQAKRYVELLSLLKEMKTSKQDFGTNKDVLTLMVIEAFYNVKEM